MEELGQLFENNRRWAAKNIAAEPDFFAKLSRLQTPEYLWIGCSDSRVPANEIVGLPPGELFVHRNVANLVIHTDMNCLSVMQYAIDNLKVKHIIICGHYACGGVKAAIENQSHGLIDNWLGHIRDIYHWETQEMSREASLTDKVNRLCELNVIEQTINAGSTTIVQDAWQRGQPIAIHGWIYDVADGLLKDLGVSISSPKELDRLRRR